MKVLRIILGIFGSLIALFCGGCGLVFVAGGPNHLEMLALASVLGFLPAALGGLLAWWAFRRRN